MPQTRTLRITFDLDDPIPTPPSEEDARAVQLLVVQAHRDQLQRDIVTACAERDAALAAQALAEQAMDVLVAQGTRTEQERDHYRDEHTPLATEVSALLLRQFELLDTVARRTREVEQVKAASEDTIAHVVGRLKAMAAALEKFGDHAEGCHDLDAESCTCGYRDAQCLVGEPA